jgi:hypothetical protein
MEREKAKDDGDHYKVLPAKHSRQQPGATFYAGLRGK